ncbi:uncharacterized protein N7477_001234 [Penicillium maclennaniae]|uniref:uncharacterized protein n=1 Tax=Penicillium maclennaniae TaxID=1343394 RepID=UPI002542558F|nr:uncharacterized protein N7477_001234 [Penicillium maclennaniae]KAJ5684889.1 hypothetical protein N7477_001234 [Penicillium maclennaniae]
MDMDSSMSGGPGLTDAGLDMSNSTVAADFLAALLDDSTLQQTDYAIARAFWYGIVIVIVLAGIINWTQWGLLKLRLRAAAANRPRPTSPSNIVTSFLAGCTAVVREIAYHQIAPARSWLRIPTVGSIMLILIYFGYIMGLQFFDWDYPGAQYWQAQGLRAGWLTIAQFPLLLLLAGKRNLIGYAVGVSYERLQILHRWVARVMLLTATIHGGVQAYGWNKYGVMNLEIDTDSCIPTGFSTWMILLWLVFSATAPIRNWRYEVFLIQHIITFIGLVVAIFFHLPSTALSSSHLFTNYTMEPGQHVFLSLPSLGLGQSHPATILSISSSHENKLVFILRAHRGFTQRLLQSAKSSSTDLSSAVRDKEGAIGQNTQEIKEEEFVSLLSGPYGGSHSDFAAFDTVFLIAGSTGVTFTLPILLDIAARSANHKLPVRKVLTQGKNQQRKQGASARMLKARVAVVIWTPEVPKAALSEDADIESIRIRQGQADTGTQLPLAYCTISSGRPALKVLLWDLLDHAQGETGVAVCGPSGLVSNVRNTVATVSEQRGSSKGTGAEGVYLHAESFAW